MMMMAMSDFGVDEDEEKGRSATRRNIQLGRTIHNTRCLKSVQLNLSIYAISYFAARKTTRPYCYASPLEWNGKTGV